MTEYNIILELAARNPTHDDVDALMDVFGDFHPTIGTSPYGWTEVIITLQAENLRQAISTGIGLGLSASAVVSVQGMVTAEFDRRPVGVEKLPELLSVGEVAERLNVSPQAVRQRLSSGSIVGTKVGGTWWVPEPAITALGKS